MIIFRPIQKNEILALNNPWEIDMPLNQIGKKVIHWE